MPVCDEGWFVYLCAVVCLWQLQHANASFRQELSDSEPVVTHLREVLDKQRSLLSLVHDAKCGELHCIVFWYLSFCCAVFWRLSCFFLTVRLFTDPCCNFELMNDVLIFACQLYVAFIKSHQVLSLHIWLAITTPSSLCCQLFATAVSTVTDCILIWNIVFSI